MRQPKRKQSPDNDNIKTEVVPASLEMSTPSKRPRDTTLTSPLSIKKTKSSTHGAKISSTSGQIDGPSDIEEVARPRNRRAAATQATSTTTTSSAMEHRQQRSAAPSIQPMVEEDTGLHRCGKHVRLLVEAVNKLGELGLDNHLIKLPQLVLVGDQSAGKSSLMGALADIQLPKGGGTCTRCPALVMTSPADSWSCNISLGQAWGYNMEFRGRTEPTKTNPFPPWFEQRSEFVHFKTIYDKGELLNVMQWAQTAILNPLSDPKIYVPGSPYFCNDEEKVAEFSPNVVRVEIRGPDLPSLSFYDLPGVVTAMPTTEQRYLIKMIMNLVKAYLSEPKSLIICALAMDRDAESSKTYDLIAEGHFEDKCVGVLTKPDLLRESGISEWEKVLDGNAFKLGHGHFITKQPEVDNRHSYRADFYQQARREEMEFFTEKAPFKDRWIFAKERYGTAKLQDFLSQFLAQKFSEDLPLVQSSIDSRIRGVDDELDSLPELPSHDQLMIVTTRLREFGLAVKQSFQGNTGDQRFKNAWTTLYESFSAAILTMKPGILVSVAQNRAIMDLTNSDDENVMMLDATPTHRATNTTMFDATPTHRAIKSEGLTSLGLSRNTPGSLFGDTQRRINFAAVATPTRGNQKATNVFAGSLSEKRRWSLLEIARAINQHTQVDLKGIISPEAPRGLIKQSISGWDKPMSVFHDHTMILIEEMMLEHFEKHLSHWQQTELYKRSKLILREYLVAMNGKQIQTNRELYDLESYKQFNIFKDVNEQNKEQELATIRKLRNFARAKDHLTRTLQATARYRASDEESRSKQLEEALLKIDSVKVEILPAETFEIEIDLAAYVRGYYITAARRFAENVVIFTSGKLFNEIECAIENLLSEKLDLTGRHATNPVERCNILMEEDHGVIHKRRDLNDEKAKLIKSKEHLERLVRDLELGNWGELGGIGVADLAIDDSSATVDEMNVDET